MNKDIINTHSKKEMKKKYNNNERWRNYAQRCQKNTFVREYLMNKYNGICQYCGLSIKKNLQLQYKTYDRECKIDTTIKIKHSTPKVPNGYRSVPDCEHCNSFHECIDEHLFPVHQGCNYRINQEIITR